MEQIRLEKEKLEKEKLENEEEIINNEEKLDLDNIKELVEILIFY